MLYFCPSPSQVTSSSPRDASPGPVTPPVHAPREAKSGGHGGGSLTGLCGRLGISFLCPNLTNR